MKKATAADDCSDGFDDCIPDKWIAVSVREQRDQNDDRDRHA
jgi:hypothetical protein